MLLFFCGDMKTHKILCLKPQNIFKKRILCTSIISQEERSWKKQSWQHKVIFFVLNATLNQKVMLNYCSCMEEFNNCGTSSGWRQCAASIQMKKEWRKKCKYLIFFLAFPLPREFFFHLEGHIWILLVPRNDFQLKLPQRSCNIWTFTECTPPLSLCEDNKKIKIRSRDWILMSR